MFLNKHLLYHVFVINGINNKVHSEYSTKYYETDRCFQILGGGMKNE